jgi:hypothetical protein
MQKDYARTLSFKGAPPPNNVRQNILEYAVCKKVHFFIGYQLINHLIPLTNSHTSNTVDK